MNKKQQQPKLPAKEQPHPNSGHDLGWGTANSNYFQRYKHAARRRRTTLGELTEALRKHHAPAA